MTTKTENSISKTKPTVLTEKVEDASNAMLVIRDQTQKTLTAYDEDRAKLAKAEGNKAPESLAEIWTQACRQQDTNEMLRGNFMQLQVIFQELYQALYAGQDKNDKETLELMDRLSGGGPEDFRKFKELKKAAAEERAKVIKQIESFAKTMKQVAAEYRQGEMAKAQFYHVSEVRAQQMFVLAIMKQFISDQTLLNNMSDALESGFSKMGSLTEGDTDG